MARITIKLPRKLRKKISIVGLILPAVIFVALSVAQFYVRCSNVANKQFLEDLCSLYLRGEVVGNMCHKLCNTDSFSYEQCGNNRWGKQVIVMSCSDCDPGQADINIVMKSSFNIPSFQTFISENINMFDNVEDIVDAAYRAVLNEFQKHFGINYSNVTRNQFMSYMWNQDFEEFLQGRRLKHEGKVAAANIRALGDQREFLFMRIFNKSKYLPRLYGTCGPTFFVEYTPSFTKLGYVLFQGKLPEVLTDNHKFPGWSMRVEVALKMLKLIKDLETSFHVPVHLCDIKSHNFALHSDNDISLLDSDSIRFENHLPYTDFPCSSDQSCSWLVCDSFCNVSTRKCDRQRTNNNLQSICDQVFLSPIASFGLLRHPPKAIESELKHLLEQCAAPGKYQPGTKMNRASMDLVDKLAGVLRKSLELV